jgi:hypothetical protein
MVAKISQEYNKLTLTYTDNSLSGSDGSETQITAFILSGASCYGDTNFIDETLCSYDWDTTLINGTYYLGINEGLSPEDYSNSSFMVDNTKPIITNPVPDNNSWVNNTTTHLTIELTDVGGSGIDTNTIIFDFNGVIYTDVNSELTFGSGVLDFDATSLVLNENVSYFISVDVNDNAKNDANTYSYFVNIDSNVPHASIVDSSISSAWVQSDTVTIGCSDSGSGCKSDMNYYFDLDGACSSTKTDYIYSTSSTSLVVNTDQNNYLCLRVEDIAGNTDTDTSFAKPLKVDVTTPTIFDNAPTTWTPSQDFNIVYSDNGFYDVNVSGLKTTSYSYTSVNNGGISLVTPNSSNEDEVILTISLVNDDVYDINYSAEDNVGLTVTNSIQVRFDGTAPSADINVLTNDNSGYTNDQKPDMNLLSVDNLSGTEKMKFSCDNNNYTTDINYATTYSDFNVLDSTYGCNANQGSKTVYVSFKDYAGNTAVAQTDINYDSINPDSNISTYPTVWTNQDQNVTITCSDTYGVDFIDYWINRDSILVDSNSVDTNSLTFSFPINSNDGNYELIYSCTDNAGNTDGNNFAYIAIDQTSPVTTLTPTTWQNTNVDSNLVCSDNNSGCDTTYYRLDTDASIDMNFVDSSWLSLSTYPITNDFNMDGNWAIEFYSIDDANNYESNTFDFVLLDKTAPGATTLTLDDAQNTTVVDLNWATVIDFSDINTYILYRQDTNASSFVAIISTIDTNYLDSAVLADTNEQYCYFVQTIDNAGNDSNSSTKCIWIDTIAPSLNSLTSSVSNKDVTLTYSATDVNGSSVVGYYVRKNSGSWVYTTSTTYVYAGLANGDYNFFVKAVDAADNNSTDMNTTATVNYTTPSPGGGGTISSSPSTGTPIDTNVPVIVDTNGDAIEPIVSAPDETNTLDITTSDVESDQSPITGDFLLNPNTGATSCAFLGVNLGSVFGICWWTWALVIIILVAIYILLKTGRLESILEKIN